MKKPIVLTAHARLRLRERDVDPKWVDETIRDPEWTEKDPRYPTIERRFRAISRFGGRVLGVACVETKSSIRVVSVMFDRNARRKPSRTMPKPTRCTSPSVAARLTGLKRPDPSFTMSMPRDI